MKLRLKVTATMTAAFVLFLGAALTIQREVVFPSFAELERDHARMDVARAMDAVQREVEHLSLLCNDWAAWDDTYAYVAGESDDYEEVNLGDVTMEEAELNFLAIYDAQGRTIYRHCVDADIEPLDLPSLAMDALPPGHVFLLDAAAEEGFSGIVATAAAPMLLAVNPILTSAGEGPSRGSIVMGRLLGQERVRDIAERTRVDITLHGADGEGLPEKAAAAMSALRDRPYATALDEEAPDSITALAYLRDVEGEPLRVLHADVPRDITSRGEMAVGVAVGTLAIASALVLGIVAWLLQRIVIGPLARLTESATKIGESGDLSRTVAMARDDEIGVLSKELDGMVRRLSRSRSALMEAARESGMAQVASGVLHNVGNVLNSLNVSTDVLIDGVKRSEMTGLDDLEQLLTAQGDGLAEFLSDPQRAAQVREFVAQLAELRRREYAACEKELVRLQSNLAHVAHIIGSQQSMVRGTAVTEPVAAAALASDAAAMVGPAFRRHDVQLIVDVDDLPTIVVDRVRLLQVLVNLLTNAKEAVKHNGREDRRVTLRGRRLGEDQIRFEVVDNGIGVEPDMIPNLFAQGFTTKDGGTGIGLHFCAVTMKTMGGSVEALSEGVGHGASFSVVFPMTADKPFAESMHV